MVRACSAQTVILASCRRISGNSISLRPKALRRRAMNIASVTERRISAAARMAFDRRELLTMSAI